MKFNELKPISLNLRYSKVLLKELKSHWLFPILGMQFVSSNIFLYPSQSQPISFLKLINSDKPIVKNMKENKFKGFGLYISWYANRKEEKI